MDESSIDKLRGIFLAALMVMSVFAGSVAFAGGAAAQDVTDATRSIDTTTVEPGETVQITVDVSLSESGGVQISDQFPSELDAEIVDGFGNLDNVQAGEVAFNNPSGTSDAYTATYAVTVPETAADGTTYDFSGTVIAGGTEATVTGDSPLTVVDEPEQLEVNDQTTVGDDLPVTFRTAADDDDHYRFEHIVDGETVDTATLADGDDNDEADADDTIQTTFAAGKTPGADSSVVEVYNESDNLIASQTYTTANYDLQVTPNEITFGDTVTLEGEIYKHPTLLADDQQFEYSVYFNDDDTNPGDERVSESDVNDGTFITTKTFNIEDNDYLKDYPADDGSGPSYEVYVRNDGTIPTPDSTNVGMDGIDLRLDMETSTEPEAPVYNTSVDVTGKLIDAAGDAITNYDAVLKDPLAGTAKVTSTAGDGTYGFTAVMNDAGEWKMATNEGGVISYTPITVQPQEANFDFTVDDQVINFPSSYDISLADSDTEQALELDENGVTDYDGYVNVTGEFEGVDSDSDDVAESLVSDNDADVIRTVDNDEDGNIDYFHVTTNSTGHADFEATPLSTEVTATLENSEADGASGIENNADSADTPNAPDYVGEETITSDGTGPVNFVQESIEDDRTGVDILDDTEDGPDVIEVLPQPEDRGNYDQSVESGYRVGYDENQNLDGLREYYIKFRLVDEENDPIIPGGLDGNLTKFEVSGLGADATIVNDGDDITVDSDNGVVLDAGEEAWGNDAGQYQLNFRPVEANSENPTVEITAYVQDEDPVTWEIDGTGLNISEFQVDDEQVDEVKGRTTPDLMAMLNAPYDDSAPVNNGRIRLARTYGDVNETLNEIDARSSNINDGEYMFSNVQVGPRGVDQDNDGIGETLADLTFTGYQYVDADDNQAPEQDEVDRGALETLNIAPEQMDIIFDAEATEHADHRVNDFNQSAFTLTKGTEYEQLAFHLQYPNGTAVDLTQGMDNTTIDLNELSEMGLVTIEGPSQEGIENTAAVLFDEEASNASEGYYIIDDIENTYWMDTDAGDSVSWGEDLTEDGVFAFDDADSADDPTRAMDTYRLNIETADRNRASWQNESTGYIDVAEPKVETDIIGVHEDSPDHDVEDDFQMIDDIDSVTTDIDRWYRVNATLTDYFGTPINGSEYSETTVDDAFGWEGTDGDDENVTFGSDAAEVSFLETFGNSLDEGDADDHELALNNESGMFQFDLKPTEADDDGDFTMQYDVSIQDAEDSEWATDSTGAPNAVFEDSPMGTRPVVEIYDQSGAKLPVDDETGNMILANDVPQTLRVEAFPSDSDDLPLPERSFMIDTDEDPVGQTTINADTHLVNASTLVTDNDDYLNIPYEQGQVTYLTVTPTGTGDGIISLRSGSVADNPVVQNVDGEEITFDVLRSNKQIDLELGSEEVTPGETVSVTATAAATGDPITLASVALSDTNGNAISDVTTDENGVAEISVPASAELGTYSLETRPAGFAPMTQSFEVRSPAQLDENLDLYAISGQTITGTSSADAGTSYTVELNGPGIVETTDASVQDDGTFSATFDLSDLDAGDEVTATIDGDSVTYTVQEPPLATVDIRQQQSSTGDVVTVSEAHLPEGGFVVIHNAAGDVIGSSDYIEPGTVEDVDVLLDSTLSAGDNQVTAMPHLDDNDNEAFDFPGNDAPYTNADDDPVTDSATVRVPESAVSTPTPEPDTDTPEPDTEEPDQTTTDSGDGDGPGFGIAVALVALLGAALLAVRRNN